MEKLNVIFDNVLEKMKTIINNDAMYFNLITNSKIIDFFNDIIYIKVENEKMLDYIKFNFYDQLLEFLKKEFECENLRIEIGVGEQFVKKVENLKNNEHLEQIEPKKITGLCNLNEQFTFDNYFLTNDTKKIKNKILCSLDEKYLHSRFPIFLYGHTGIGKTHLACAFARYAFELNPKLNVNYISANSLTNKITTALTAPNVYISLEKIKQELLINDILIIDDFQLLAEREKTLKTLVDFFNEMKAKNMILILTSDRHLESINGLSDRMMSRLHGGLKLHMPSLSIESTKEFVKEAIEASNFNLKLTDDALICLGFNYKNDLRSLLGALSSLELNFQFDVSLEPFDKEKVINILGLKNVIIPNEKNSNIVEINITPELIINAVSQQQAISTATIKSNSRVKKAVFARHLIFYVLYKKLNLQHSEIGKIFNKDRSTITLALKKNIDKFDKDESIQALINNIFSELHS